MSQSIGGSIKAKLFLYEELGFPVILTDVSVLKKRRVSTPAIDYSKLQKGILLALTHKSFLANGFEGLIQFEEMTNIDSYEPKHGCKTVRNNG